jgi:hypothetical protein
MIGALLHHTWTTWMTTFLDDDDYHSLQILTTEMTSEQRNGDRDALVVEHEIDCLAGAGDGALPFHPKCKKI